MKDTYQREIRAVRRIELSDKDLLEWLRRKFSISKGDKVSLEFQVPGGADWSNSRIDIDEENPVHLTIETNTTDDGDE